MDSARITVEVYKLMGPSPVGRQTVSRQCCRDVGRAARLPAGPDVGRVEDWLPERIAAAAGVSGGLWRNGCGS